MFKSLFSRVLVTCVFVAAASAQPVIAPDALVRQVSNEVIDTVKSDK